MHREACHYFQYGNALQVFDTVVVFLICHTLAFCLVSVCSPIQTVYPDHSDVTLRYRLPGFQISGKSWQGIQGKIHVAFIG